MNNINKQRRLLVTTALPYANGPIHLGHMVEYTQADIWVRFQRLLGHSCIFLSGDDAHGTAIMIAAQKQNISPETLVKQIHTEHAKDLKDFSIEYDNFYTTHSSENQILANDIYLCLKQQKDIFQKEISQAFDPIEKVFLPDRFIRGQCPKCNALDQYGDNCEVCGATYTSSELKNPVSILSGATPINKNSEHYFFALEKYRDFLQNWLQSSKLQTAVSNKLLEWFSDELKPWDISRDAPYFGFEIPNAPGKYFYVWLDAPIGYMASLKNFEKKQTNIKFENYWNLDSDAEVYHFVGKDIIYFHALFWPAILKAANFRLPTSVFAHGYLTINGQKMSKSRGTFITARQYLENLNAHYLRYYFATKLGPGLDDIDLNWDDFSLRVNADLIGKYINLASRCAGFITKFCDHQLADHLDDNNLFQKFVTTSDTIAQYYETLNFNKAMREIMALADAANQYIDAKKPWEMAKNAEEIASVQNVCTMGLNLFRILSILLQPVLPDIAKEIENFLNIPPLSWADISKPLLAHRINTYQPLMQRIPLEALNQLKQCEFSRI